MVPAAVLVAWCRYDIGPASASMGESTACGVTGRIEDDEIRVAVGVEPAIGR
jgi:hypothetical protein